MNGPHYIRTAVLGLMLFLATQAQAIAPPYVSDEQLAAYPIIVVAKWDKAPFERHDNYRQDEEFGPVITESEGYTKLNVLRVVKGKVKPGVHELMLGYGIAWSENATWVTSGTSTEMPGDVRDITKPDLWFLGRRRSWDKKRRTDYLSISNYREIQPLALEKHFAALASADPTKAVPRLLTPDEPVVATRVLRYICGGIWPWPYDPDRYEMMYMNPQKRGKVLRKEADRVWTIVKSNAQDLRPRAAAVYAELKGRDSIKAMRTLLTDENPIVRGVAIGILSRHRDVASLDGIQKAIKGVDEGWLACKQIDALSSWEEDLVVPLLITFLQNDRFVYQYGDDLGIPALKARQALHKITGHWFPFDVGKSTNAWDKAKQIQDKTKRRELLQKILPGRQFPVLAEAIGHPRYGPVKPGRGPSILSFVHTTDTDEATFTDVSERDAFATVRIRNVTPQPVSIAKRPCALSMVWPLRSSSHSYGYPGNRDNKREFVTAAPGESFEFEVRLDESFLISKPSTRSLKLSYQVNGNSVGLNAWIGMLEVKFGSEWKMKRRIK